MVFGILSSIAIPQFKPATNKAKQKEASLIVSSMIKAAKSNYALVAGLPGDMGQLSKFARFQKCISNNVETEGSSVCKSATPVPVEKNDVLFYSPSGNYKIEMRRVATVDDVQIYQVKANPNGGTFATDGSAVVGCYNPLNGISLVKEYSSKASEKGTKSYITCGDYSRTEPIPNPPIPNPPIPEPPDPRIPEPPIPEPPEPPIPDPLPKTESVESVTQPRTNTNVSTSISPPGINLSDQETKVDPAPKEGPLPSTNKRIKNRNQVIDPERASNERGSDQPTRLDPIPEPEAEPAPVPPWIK